MSGANRFDLCRVDLARVLRRREPSEAAELFAELSDGEVLSYERASALPCGVLSDVSRLASELDLRLADTGRGYALAAACDTVPAPALGGAEC
jgi:hypothetical protein